MPFGGGLDEEGGGRQSGGRNLSLPPPPWCSLLEGWLDVGQGGPTSQPGRAGAGVVLPDSLSCSSSFQNTQVSVGQPGKVRFYPTIILCAESVTHQLHPSCRYSPFTIPAVHCGGAHARRAGRAA